MENHQKQQLLQLLSSELCVFQIREENRDDVLERYVTRH